MPSSNLTGKVQTVLGPIEPSKLGKTLTHEHILFDGTWTGNLFESATDQAFYEKPVSQEILGIIRHRGKLNKENGRLNDIDDAIYEVGLFKQHGGGTLVDATSIGVDLNADG